MLYIIPTPIGNLEDITMRALRLLKEVDFVLAEDTRKSGLLLAHFAIKKPFVPYHAHNEHTAVKKIVERLKKGETAALISDAGTPAISDPGYLIVRECITNSIPIECLPGATAFVPALVVSGLPADRFSFEGFLPHKKGRQTKFKELAEREHTFILYESPHRLIKTLQQIVEFLGPERSLSVSRELTKKFEETVRGSAAEVLAHFGEKTIKGEFVIVVGGKE